jgi:hypothetical protein
MMFRRVKLAIAGSWLDQDKRLLLLALHELVYYDRPGLIGDGGNGDEYIYWNDSGYNDRSVAIRDTITSTPTEGVYPEAMSALEKGGLLYSEAHDLVKLLTDRCLNEGVAPWRIKLITAIPSEIENVTATS